MFRALLAAIKPVENQDVVVRYAVSLAEQYSLEVEGCCVTDLSRLAPIEPLPLGASHYKTERDKHLVRDAREQALENISRLFELCRQRDVFCQSQLCEGNSLQVLGEVGQRCDLIVCGVSQHADFGEASLLHSLLKHGGRPTIVVPEGEFRVSRVLIAFDGSIQAGRALASFAYSGFAGDCCIDLLTIDNENSQAERIAESARRFLGRHGITATIRTVGAEHDIAAQILTIAAEISADLLVMGSFGKSAFRDFFLGSVTRSILMALKIPVLLDH